MTSMYEKLFFQAFKCSPNESKALEEYSKDELIRLINLLKEAVDGSNTARVVLEDERLTENEDFGLAVIAENAEDLETFEEFCSRNFLPISKGNRHVSSTCNQTMIDQYLTTGINHLRTEYIMIILLKNVQYVESLSINRKQIFVLNTKIYKYQLKVLHQDPNESHEALLMKIRDQLLGEVFVVDHDDHASIPSLPAPKQPQFVSIFPHTQIACWPLPRRRDLNRFREELDVTHILTLLNPSEIKQTNICQLIQSAGIQSLHIPIDGGDLPVFTSSQTTVDILNERLPAVRDLLLNSTATAPVKMIIHCSAGLHRTGTITCLLLRLCRFDFDRSLLIINRSRAITARQVGKKRVDAVECNLLKKIP